MIRRPERELRRRARFLLQRERNERLRARLLAEARQPNQNENDYESDEGEGELNEANRPAEIDDQLPDEGLNDDGNENQENVHEQENDLPADDNNQAEEEGEEEDDEVEEELDIRQHRALYEGANITVGEVMVLVLSLMLRHHITASCAQDILAMLPLICPRNGFQHVSYHRFKNFFSIGKQHAYKRHWYCTSCSLSIPDQNADCRLCENERKVSYFIELSFISQFQQMLKRANFYELLQHRFQRGNRRADSIDDIYDGQIYRTQVETGFLADGNNVSFCYYIDGVPVFSSSKVSFQPIYLLINELPYRARTCPENILLAGLWFGKKKANTNLFLDKMRPQFEIFLRGKNFTLRNGDVVRMRGILLAGTCDVPAKTDILKLTLFSGSFGCCNCKLEGYTYYHPTGGTSHVYPYRRHNEERTSEETNEQGTQVARLELENGIMGVKGVSVLHQLMPDYIGGTGIDVMHKVYGGTVKKLLFLWFDSSYSGQPFSLRLAIQNIDQRIRKIKPAKFIHRMPRSVEELCHWQCSELHMWLYYFSLPVLSGIMLEVYYDHFCLLVHAMSLLNSNSILMADIEKARCLLQKFVSQFSELYGERQMTINVHGLLHLVDCCLRLGPCWVVNCFPMENMNGQLLKLIHGTSNIESQIADRHNNRIKFQHMLEDIRDGPLRDFILNLKKKQVKVVDRIFQGCYTVGLSHILQEVPCDIAAALQNDNIDQQGTVSVYHRLLKDSLLYVSESYPPVMKTISSFVTFFKNNESKVGSIIKFLKITNCNCLNVCHCAGEHLALIQDYISTDYFYAVGRYNRPLPMWHLKKSERSNHTSAVPVNNLKSVCVYISVTEQESFIGVPINTQEKE